MKAKKTHKPAAAQTEVLDYFAPLYSKGIEVVAEVQKKALEVAAEQNAELAAASKKALTRFLPASQVDPVFDLAAQAFDTLLQGHKEAIDLVLEQNQAAVGFAKGGVESVTKLTNGLTALFQESVKRTVAVQKKALDFAAEQNKAVCATAARQYGLSANPMETLQRSLDVLMETQKKVLDIATQPLKAKTTAA
jgi:hypothetical protein